MFDQPLPGPEKLMWPVFVREGCGVREPIDAMPGQFRTSPDALVKDVARVVAMGVGSVLLFGLVDEAKKDGAGSAVTDDRGAVQQALHLLRREFPDLVLATDVCVCGATTHGHCGPLGADGEVDNDAAHEVLARMAVSHAAAGADIVAPSAMMDGQVAAIRRALADEGLNQTLVMSYSTKFASAMYGPFRVAEQSAPRQGDRRGYQTSPLNPRLALRESAMDEAEGADILMVKPALFYLDVLAALRGRTDLPLAAYNVSGEYSMLIATAERGWGDLGAMVRESLAGMARAGADLIVTYWAGRWDEVAGGRGGL
jgi:porphobilinogen synthase